MPTIRLMDSPADSVTITTHKGTRTLTRADIPANVINKPIATIEGFVRQWLATNIPECQMDVHITSVTPTLLWTFVAADPNITIPPNWWGS